MSGEWLLIRGSGVVAFALLTAATIWGLLVSSKLLGRLVKAKTLTWFHESLGIGALLATLMHVGVLSVHDYLDFTWLELVVPGWSDWRPLAVALGIVAFYGLALDQLLPQEMDWPESLENDPLRFDRGFRRLPAPWDVGRHRHPGPADDRAVRRVRCGRVHPHRLPHRHRGVDGPDISRATGA
jgi:hypothetical protein